MSLGRYETNPMTVLLITSHNEWHTLLIDIVGILGGIFTVAPSRWRRPAGTLAIPGSPR